MSGRFLFILGQTLDEPVTWARIEGGDVIDGGEAVDRDELATIGEKIVAADRAIALIPGEQLAMRLMQAPPKNAVKLAAAAHYLLDDELGEPVSDLHIVAADGAAYAVKHRILDGWVEAFIAAGIELDMLTADCLCLPVEEQKTTLFIGRNRTLAVLGGRRFAAENRLAEQLLAAELSEEKLENLSIYKMQYATVALTGGSAETIRELDSDGVIKLFLKGLDEGEPVNLLQGKYKNVRRWRETFQVWRRAGALAAIAAAAGFLGFIAGGIEDLRAAGAFEKRAAELQETYLPEAAGRDLRAYANEILSARRGASFLPLASVFSDAINQTEGVRIDRLRFDQARGQLVVSVRSDSDANIEALRVALAERNIAAQEAGGYRRIGNEWAGDMVVRLP